MTVTNIAILDNEFPLEQMGSGDSGHRELQAYSIGS
jgi:hypothetical protein